MPGYKFRVPSELHFLLLLGFLALYDVASILPAYAASVQGTSDRGETLRSFARYNGDGCSPYVQLRPRPYTSKGQSNVDLEGKHAWPYTCQPKGRRIPHSPCHLVNAGKQFYALCSNSNITDLTNLSLPHNITVLCLDNNQIKSIGPNAFSNYSTLRFLDLSDNIYLGNISENAFEGLNNLEKLFLSNTTVGQIENNTFVPLKNLKSLSLAFWAPKVRTPEELDLPCLQSLVHTKVTKLDLSGINKQTPQGLFWDLRSPTFSVLSNLSITQLWLKHNQIIAIRKDVLSNFQNLQKLWLSHNLLLGGDSSVVLHDLQLMRNLTLLDITYQNYVYLNWEEDPKWAGYVPSIRNLIEAPKMNQVVTVDVKPSNFEFSNDSCNFVLPPNLRKLCMGHSNIVEDINIDNVNICPNNSLTSIYAGHILVRHIYRGILRWLPNLTILDLHSSRIIVRNLQMFKKLTGLKTLNLENFSLSRMLNSSKAWTNFIEYTKFPKLTKLNIANNHLHYVSPKFVSNFPSLERLNLGNNHLRSVPVWLQNFTNLNYIDLTYNKLVNISVATISDWRNASMTRNITIDLSNNWFICTCNDEKMIEIAQRSNKTLNLIGFKCQFFPSREIWNISAVYLWGMRRRCHRTTNFIAFYVTYGIVLLCSLLSSVTYRNRHSLQYIWYYIKYRRIHHLVRMESQHMVTHDVFFCCATDDLGTMESFYNKIEKIHHYRLFIIERDGLGCKTAADGIKDAFSCCHNIILVVSPRAVKGPYFKYITHLARESSDRQRSKVVCLLLEKRHLLPEWLVPDTLEYLMSTSLCLPWNPEAVKDPLFWMRLREALGPPLQQLPLENI